MILCDKDIKKRLEEGSLELSSDLPKEELIKQIHASSMDIRLGNNFKVYRHAEVALLDPRNSDGFSELTTLINVEDDKPFYVQPGEFVLGVTKEKIKVPNDLVVRVEGRSSLGRLGIIVHSTAGFVDPGFEGTITLEISNLNRLPIALYPGMRIGQYAFELMTGECEEPYYMKKSSKYHGQELPEESRITDDPEFKE